MFRLLSKRRSLARDVDTRVGMKMRATVFRGVNDLRVEEVERPKAGPGEAVIRVTMTTICGTDVHILKGEYTFRPGLVIGLEPVGVIEELARG
jgi:threonine dehydrogenase-like Zn-dependent dehydrogenase